MRRQLTAYLSEEEYHRLRDEADERGVTLSRYVKERLFKGEPGSGLTLSDATLAATEKRVIQAMRTAGAESLKPLTLQLTTLLTMLDSLCVEHAEPSAGDSRSAAQGGARLGSAPSSRLGAEVEETLKRMQQPAPAFRNDGKGESA